MSFRTLLIFLALFWASDLAHGQCDDKFLERFEISLIEKNEPIGDITSAATLSDGTLVIATANPAAVSLYSQSGERLAQVGQSGPGPFEYQSPSVVRTDRNRIAVWDSESLKLITYDRKGQELNEWTNFYQAVADFELVGDTLFTYRTGGRHQGYITGHSLKQEETVFETGESPIEHAVLMMLEGSGTLSAHRNALFYASPAHPRVYAYRFNDRVTDELTISDPAFEVGDSGFSSISGIGSSRKEAVEFMSENSRFYKLNVFESSLLAVLEHGTVSYGENRIEDFDRYLHVHHLSNGGTSLACERVNLNLKKTGADPIIGRSDRGFLVVKTQRTSDDQDFTYLLIEWRVPVE